MSAAFFGKICSKKVHAQQTYSLLDCKIQLMVDFPHIFSYTIARLVEFHNGKYINAYKSLLSIMDAIIEKYPDFGTNPQSKTLHTVYVKIKNEEGRSELIISHTMPSPRTRIRTKPLPLRLKQEIDFIKEQRTVGHEEADRRFAMNLLEGEYIEMGQLIECACCYKNCVFEDMAQCMEGHLVCVECLNAFTKETVYGAGKIALGCMASDCAAVYPEGELKRCLPVATWSKLEERALNDNLNMAEVEDLVKCPYCDFAAILSPRVKIFHCYKDNCQKETCRDCGTDWVEHEGKACSAVEKSDETKLRKTFEEMMTKAKVRTCVRCRAEFTKESGCNKMTCRCGMTMCYICRMPRVNYDHFCRHPLDPGKLCSICTLCNLFTKSEVDDERAMEEIQKEAQIRRKELGYEDVKLIGTPSTSKD